MQNRNRKQITQILLENQWFKDLPQEILETFARSAQIHQLKNGESFAGRGLAPLGVAIIIRGGICSSSFSKDGHEITFSLLKPGTLWGLVAVMDGCGTVHDTRAHGETEVLVIPPTVFLEALDHSPLLYRHFARILCYRLRKAYSIVDELALIPLRQRLARQLCALAEHGEDDIGEVITVTQDELAGLLGVSRPAVNRELKQLERELLITLRYSCIVLNDFVQLRNLCAHQKIFPL